jgi:hypothetical protein
MIRKGIKMKYNIIIYISFIFLAGVLAWGGVLFNSIIILVFDAFPEYIWTLYFIVQGGFLFIVHFIWYIGISKLTSIEGKRRKYFLGILGLIIAILQISYWYWIFIEQVPLAVQTFGPLATTDFQTVLGTAVFPFIVFYSEISYIYLTISLLFFIFGVGWIVVESFGAKKPRVRLKSRFLTIYIIGIAFGSIMEIYRNLLFSWMDPVLASIIAKIILTIAVLSGYIGFVLPPSIERLFLEN